MEERNSHIEQWLREAAARQEQEQAPVADKQAAWEAMRRQLDEPSTGGFPWKRWLGGAIFAVIVLVSVLYFVVREKPREAVVQQKMATSRVDDAGNNGMTNGSNTAAFEDTALKGVSNRNKSEANGSTTVSNPDKTASGAGTNVNNPAANASGNGNKTVTNRVVENKGNTGAANSTTGNLPENNAGIAGNLSGKKEAANGNNTEPINAAVTNGGATLNSGNNTTGHSSGGNVVNKRGASSAFLQPAANNNKPNDGLNNLKQPGAAQLTPQTNRTSPQSIVAPIPAASRFNTIPDAGLRHTPTRVQGEAPALTTWKPINYSPSGFSVKVAGIVPLSGAFGGNAAAEYTFNLAGKFRIRPHLGIGYISGFSETFKHQKRSTRPTSPGSSDYFIDSVSTTYTATAVTFGEGGIQLAYGYKRWEAMLGLTYQHIFSIKGRKDSTSRTRLDSLPNFQYASKNFSTSDLPGKGKLMLQAGLSYMLTPQLQAGVRYHLQLMGTKAGEGIIGPAPSLPLKSSLEVQVRWYFRRSERE